MVGHIQPIAHTDMQALEVRAVTVGVAQELELAGVVVWADLRQMAMEAMVKMAHLWVRFMF
ncbi:MAG: hypothetical protein IJG84_14160 [Kiritimatiellae bacterium]|nr:hypothetical protein [Kiritimatiellia bacterium]